MFTRVHESSSDVQFANKIVPSSLESDLLSKSVDPVNKTGLNASYINKIEGLNASYINLIELIQLLSSTKTVSHWRATFPVKSIGLFDFKMIIWFQKTCNTAHKSHGYFYDTFNYAFYHFGCLTAPVHIWKRLSRNISKNSSFVFYLHVWKIVNYVNNIKTLFSVWLWTIPLKGNSASRTSKRSLVITHRISHIHTRHKILWEQNKLINVVTSSEICADKVTVNHYLQS